MVVRIDDNCLKIELVQDVTSYWVKGKLEQIKDAMKGEEPYKDIVVDMGGVNIIDSIGVILIIALYKTAEELNKDFKVVGLNGRVSNLFKMMRIDKIFPVEA